MYEPDVSRRELLTIDIRHIKRTDPISLIVEHCPEIRAEVDYHDYRFDQSWLAGEHAQVPASAVSDSQIKPDLLLKVK